MANYIDIRLKNCQELQNEHITKSTHDWSHDWSWTMSLCRQSIHLWL